MNKYTIINKHLMLVKGNGSYSFVKPNIFEMIKAYCIAEAKGSFINHLPYITLDIPDDLPHLESWRQAFTCDNSPQRISFRGKHEQLAKELESVDFSKPFSPDVANTIREKFPANPQKKVSVDADLIIQGELGELDEKEEK